MGPKKTYPAGFRQQMVVLARSGRSAKDLAKEFEPTTHQTINAWVRQAERDEGGHSTYVDSFAESQSITTSCI